MHLHPDTPATAVAPLRINREPATNRVNPAEMRHLRRVVAATTICCLSTAVQTEVTRAHAEGMNLTEEARVLLAEFGLPTSLAVAPMAAR